MNKIIIVGFEGYLQGDDSYVKENLVSPLATQFKEVQYLMFSHRQEPFIKDVTLAIGHSFGGDAVLKFAQKHRPKYVITCDPRHDSPLSFLDALFPIFRNFKAPEGTKVFNFYRRGFLPGYKVIGAVSNDKLDCAHWDVPAEPIVLSLAKDIIKGAIKT